MLNHNVVALRMEYNALRTVADGLYAMLRAGAACNLLTIARMADEARNAARRLANEIEQLCRGVCREVRLDVQQVGLHPLARLVEAMRELPRLLSAALSAA